MAEVFRVSAVYSSFFYLSTSIYILMHCISSFHIVAIGLITFNLIIKLSNTHHFSSLEYSSFVLATAQLVFFRLHSCTASCREFDMEFLFFINSKFKQPQPVCTIFITEMRRFHLPQLSIQHKRISVSLSQAKRLRMSACLSDASHKSALSDVVQIPPSEGNVADICVLQFYLCLPVCAKNSVIFFICFFSAIVFSAYAILFQSENKIRGKFVKQEFSSSKKLQRRI